MLGGVRKIRLIERTRKGLAFIILGNGFLLLAGLVTPNLVGALVDLNFAAFVFLLFAAAFEVTGWTLFVMGRRAYGRRHAHALRTAAVALAVVAAGALVVGLLITNNFPGASADAVNANRGILGAALLGLAVLSGLPYFLGTFHILDRGGRALAAAAWVLTALGVLYLLQHFTTSRSLSFVSGISVTTESLRDFASQGQGFLVLVTILWTLALAIAFRRVSTGSALLSPAPGGRWVPAGTSNSGLACGACGTPLPVGVALCPACGADPWLNRVKVEEVEAVTPPTQ